MAFKFVFAITFIAVASAAYTPATQVYHDAPVAVQAAPVALAQNVVVKSEEHDPHPQYRYSYGVEDKLTGDSKSHVEERDGDVVRGEYSLIDADGYKRTVQYTADAHNGFNAVVHREPPVNDITTGAHYGAPAVVKTIPIVGHYTAPTVVKTAAPVTHYSAPAATHYSAPSPLAHYSGPVAHYRAPVAHYRAPVAHYTATVAQHSAPVSYYTAPTQFTSYVSPAVSYHN